jgi:hypothetical protein
MQNIRYVHSVLPPSTDSIPTTLCLGQMNVVHNFLKQKQAKAALCLTKHYSMKTQGEWM